MRLFLALKPDRAAEARLAQRILAVQEALGEAAAALRWTPATNVHLTLHFLGEVRDTGVRRLREGLDAPLEVGPFDVGVDDAGAFPASGVPRVIWLDISQGAREVASVHAELGARLAAAGFVPESRPFSPHLTIARVPDRERGRVKRVRELLQRVPPGPIGWTAFSVTLFSSDLSGAVPRYDVVQEISFTTHAG